MRKLLCLAMITLTVCSGCGRLTNDLQKDLGYLTEDNGSKVFPDGMCDGGEKYFGNGKQEDSDDIFTVLENKIWG